MSDWPKESRAVTRAAKSQIHFDFTTSTFKALKIEAADKGISPSDAIRNILGLESSGAVHRPRVGVSFGSEERAELSKELALDDGESAEFKRRCQEKINLYFRKE